MKHERYVQLMREDDARLTDEEKSQGWHFCHEWDGLLIGPSWPEMESCTCEREATP